MTVSNPLPDLSRFELQCLSKLWERGEASVRDVLGDLEDPPSYSTVRKIFERLEEKGAVERVGQEGKAVLYRSLVAARPMIRKEIQRFLDTMFAGSAEPLVSHLAEMKAVSAEDLALLERVLEREPRDDKEIEAEGRRR